MRPKSSKGYMDLAKKLRELVSPQEADNKAGRARKIGGTKNTNRKENIFWTEKILSLTLRMDLFGRGTSCGDSSVAVVLFLGACPIFLIRGGLRSIIELNNEFRSALSVDGTSFALFGGDGLAGYERAEHK